MLIETRDEKLDFHHTVSAFDTEENKRRMFVYVVSGETQYGYYELIPVEVVLL